MVYVLEGELLLRSDDGEERLSAGMVVGFKAGVANGHQFVNPGPAPAVYLEISNRAGAVDRVHYTDVDLAFETDAGDHTLYTHKDGTPY